MSPAVPISTNPTGLERLQSKPGATAEQEKVRLKKATKEFESFFMYYMMKTMRSTVPQNPLAENLPLQQDNSKEMMQDMFDMEVSRRLNTNGDRSLASMLYNSVSKLIDAKYAGKEGDVKISPLHPAKTIHQKAIELHKAATPLPLPEATPTPLEPGKEPIPIKVEGRSVSSPITNADPIRERYGDFIDAAAEAHDLDSALIAAVIKVESDGIASAVSPKGAQGLMQLTPKTSQDLKIADPFDPKANIDGGARYLKRLITRFGDIRMALAAYNAGPTAVSEHAGIPPYPETVAYVDKVTRLYQTPRVGKSE